MRAYLDTHIQNSTQRAERRPLGPSDPTAPSANRIPYTVYTPSFSPAPAPKGSSPRTFCRGTGNRTCVRRFGPHGGARTSGALDASYPTYTRFTFVLDIQEDPSEFHTPSRVYHTQLCMNLRRRLVLEETTTRESHNDGVPST